MAGEWIKMRTNLWDDPRVSRLVDLTDTAEATVIGGLYWVWATADEHSLDGAMPGLTLRAVDRKTGVSGLADALVDVGWLEDHPEGVRLVRFDEHNGASAKTRAQTAKRVANHRSNADVTQAPLQEQHDGVTDALAREEKRREEKKVKTEEVPSSLSEADIAFEFPLNDGSVYQLSLTQVAEFQELYPAANVDGELRACLGWNRANPKKRKTRSGILKHINTWLADKQNSPAQRAPSRGAAPATTYQPRNARSAAAAAIFDFSNGQGEIVDV